MKPDVRNVESDVVLGSWVEIFFGTRYWRRDALQFAPVDTTFKG